MSEKSPYKRGGYMPIGFKTKRKKVSDYPDMCKPKKKARRQTNG